MARNEEKQYCRLNRIILQRQREDEAKKNPKRPPLNSLRSVAEIKHWLPTIKKDIDFYITQSKVWCYPERKIAEFNTRIDGLQREYQAFVRRLILEEPECRVLPGTHRSYTVSAKRAAPTNTDVKYDTSTSGDRHANKPITSQRKRLKRIVLPILDSITEQHYVQEKCQPAIDCTSTSQRESHEKTIDQVTTDGLPLRGQILPASNFENVNHQMLNQPLDFRSLSSLDIHKSSEGVLNPLGLDYSDSSED